MFTVSSASKGNRALQYPIGIITADEVAYAGGVYYKNNSSYYLYTNQNYWTMSPYRFRGGNAWVFSVTSSGQLTSSFLNNTKGVRPVINLKANVQISTGSGTSSDPYVIA